MPERNRIRRLVNLHDGVGGAGRIINAAQIGDDLARQGRLARTQITSQAHDIARPQGRREAMSQRRGRGDIGQDEWWRMAHASRITKPGGDGKR